MVVTFLTCVHATLVTSLAKFLVFDHLSTFTKVHQPIHPADAEVDAVVSVIVCDVFVDTVTDTSSGVLYSEGGDVTSV